MIEETKLTAGLVRLSDELGVSNGMREIRIAWRIGSQDGGGLWRHDTKQERNVLAGSCESLCERYGAGTHWLETRGA